MSNFGINRGQAGLIGRLNAAGGGQVNTYVVATPPVFDGTNDYLTRGAGFTGAADSKTGIYSAWLRLDGGNGADLTLVQGTGSFVRFFRASTGVFTFNCFSSGATQLLGMSSSTTYAASSSWINILAAWNVGSGVAQMYVNDVDVRAGSPTVVDGSIDYTLANWGICGEVTAGLKMNGAICEVYFAPGQYLDISSAANRQKFIYLGKPADLGSDGSTPTGTAPILYLKNAYDTFNVNSGTGGNLTLTGTLTASATSPSD